MTRKIRGEISGMVSEVLIGDHLDSEICRSLERFDESLMFVSKGIPDPLRERISRIEGADRTYHLDDGESCKTIETYNNLVLMLLERNFPRSGLISYAGGGTLGDLAGFLSSTYKRGTPLHAIPTTLLAQVDSAIGGKNGLNASSVKNAIGTFHVPGMIFCDISVLNEKVLADGLSEVVKYGMIGDPSILEILESLTRENLIEDRGSLLALVEKSVSLKMKMVSEDLYDRKGIRSTLNFGHTIGHAIESATSNMVSHGRAVAGGMILESVIGEIAGIASEKYSGFIKRLLVDLGIELPRIRREDADRILSYIGNDKKVENGNIILNVPVSPGIPVGVKLEPHDFRKLLQEAILEYEK